MGARVVGERVGEVGDAVGQHSSNPAFDASQLARPSAAVARVSYCSVLLRPL